MRRNYSRIGLGIAAITIAALTVLPSTGWIVRQQLRVLAGGTAPSFEMAGSPAWNASSEKQKAVAALHPDDFQLQLAWALRTREIAEYNAPINPELYSAPTNSSDRLKGGLLLGILPLQAKFADRAELQGDILRFLCMGDLRISRSEEDILLPANASTESAANAREASAKAKRRIASPQAIKLAQESAIRGEAFDPQNAYFPTLLAAALLADHRDSEAVAALARAADKPRWNDFAGDEARARTAMIVAANGSEPGAITRISAAAAILLPDIAVVRDEARVMTALAVQRELRGDREGGFAIRRSVARLGATMRSQPQSLIASLVGSAITGVASARPGGSPPADTMVKSDGDVDLATSEARYVAYLAGIGHADEARWYAAECSNGARAAQVIKHTPDVSDDFIRPYVGVTVCDVACLYLLSSAILMIAVGGISAVLAGTAHAKASLPLRRAIGFGLLAVLQLPILFAVGNALFSEFGMTTVGFHFVCLDAVVVGVVLIFLKQRRTWLEFRNEVSVVITTILSASVLLVCAVWFGERIGQPLGALGILSGTCSSAVAIVSQGGLIGLIFVLPTLALIFLAIRSKIRRIPVSIGLVRGFARIAVPSTAALLVLYSCLVFITLAKESIARTEVNHQLTDECKFEAGRLGLEWPGVTDVSGTSTDQAIK